MNNLEAIEVLKSFKVKEDTSNVEHVKNQLDVTQTEINNEIHNSEVKLLALELLCDHIIYQIIVSLISINAEQFFHFHFVTQLLYYSLNLLKREVKLRKQEWITKY